MATVTTVKDTMQQKLTQTYLAGVYLAINAIKQAYLLVDAPNCCFKKGEYIDKNHDFFSDIFDKDGYHRIAHTDATTQAVINDRTQSIEDMLVKMAEYVKAQAVFLASMPSASLTGIQYDLVIKKAQRRSKKPILEIPAKNMRYDWMEGYADVLLSIAKQLKLGKAVRSKNKVAIVGYFMDRTEGDHTGNLLELKRLLKAIGLDLVSTWLDGSSFNELKKVESAGTIISFPYGRKAAREIAKHTGAKLIEVDLPFGLEGSKLWLEAIGSALGKKQAVKKVIKNELAEVVPILKWVIPKFITNKSFTVLSDPYLGRSLVGMLKEFGGEVNSLVSIGALDNKEGLEDVQVLVDPYLSEVEQAGIAAVDIGIGSSLGKKYFKGNPYLQFGVPSPGNHCFYTKPFLGFKGLVIFINRIVNLSNSGLVVG